MQIIDWKTVMGLIQRKTKLIDVEAEKERIKSLIHTAALKSSSSEWLVWREAVVDVKNGLAKLPCDLIRLLKAFDNVGNIISGRRNGEYLSAPYKEGKIQIHYYAIPLVETPDGEKLPMLLYEFSDWYVWYVIHTFMFDEWMEGRIPSDRWSYIENEYINAYDQAMGSIDLLSITDLEEQLFMMRNGIFYDNSAI